MSKNPSSRHNRLSPQHRGVPSGGRTPRGRAKSPKNGGRPIEDDTAFMERMQAQAGLIHLLMPYLPSAE